MLGAIIGDIVGSPFEGGPAVSKDFPLFSARSHATDDTVMTIAVADALLRDASAPPFVDALKEWGRRYPDAGYGLRFLLWVMSAERSPYGSWGNGSAMRVSPCAWYATSLEQAEDLARRSACVTHDHPEGIRGAQATAGAIYLARSQASHAQIREYVRTTHGYDLSRSLDEIRASSSFDESCRGTVPEALTAYLDSSGFLDAVRNAVSIGGDTDTLAAITGAIAEAEYGVPASVATQALDALDERMRGVLDAWARAGLSHGVVVPDGDADRLRP
ncbi:MAG: ADP-ribosylglycohydrolase family protein [Propionibacteriaceae bacterium]|nr:ADP-ribosylglycohydrolase family protein [Propionibacteriaceae bacterium]